MLCVRFVHMSVGFLSKTVIITFGGVPLSFGFTQEVSLPKLVNSIFASALSMGLVTEYWIKTHLLLPKSIGCSAITFPLSEMAFIMYLPFGNEI